MEKIRAVVIGFGSIGKRHAEILSSLNCVEKVIVLSNQKHIPYESINKLGDVSRMRPDYVVIAQETSEHFKVLSFLEEELNKKTILVEKPLFDRYRWFSIKKNTVFVAYNFRFHPGIQLVKQLIVGRKLWSVEARCTSYLPDWRPGRDYREIYSRTLQRGGGALLDLSHELDYVRWLFGDLQLKWAAVEKISNLEIESDDFVSVFAENEKKVRLHIKLNYFTRYPIRTLIICGENIEIQLDLIGNKALVYCDGEEKKYEWPQLVRNSTYELQHRAAIRKDSEMICSFQFGLDTMNLIDGIRSWAA